MQAEAVRHEYASKTDCPEFFVIFDLETTGLRRQVDEITQFAYAITKRCYGYASQITEIRKERRKEPREAKLKCRAL